MTTKTERIRALNDQLRTTGQGGDLVVTRGIASLSLPSKVAIFDAVQAFDQFNPDNDPYGEHDFGLLEVAGQRIMFKIDYYDCSKLHRRGIRGCHISTIRPPSASPCLIKLKPSNRSLVNDVCQLSQMA